MSKDIILGSKTFDNVNKVKDVVLCFNNTFPLIFIIGAVFPDPNSILLPRDKEGMWNRFKELKLNVYESMESKTSVNNDMFDELYNKHKFNVINHYREEHVRLFKKSNIFEVQDILYADPGK